jgi:hypothetical protein
MITEFKIENMIPFKELKNKKSAQHCLLYLDGKLSDVWCISEPSYERLRNIGVIQGVEDGFVRIYDKRVDGVWNVPTVCFKGVRK